MLSGGSEMMSKAKALLKTIRLYPTQFECDIWICGDMNHLDKCYHKRYGIGFIDNDTKGDAECSRIESAKTSEIGAEKRIALAFSKYDHTHFAHESVHCLNHLSHWTNIEIGFNSQEWNAYFIEYVFSECIDKK